MSLKKYDSELKKELKRREKWLQKYWGKKCPEYVKSCPLCEVWRNHEKFKNLV